MQGNALHRDVWYFTWILTGMLLPLCAGCGRITGFDSFSRVAQPLFMVSLTISSENHRHIVEKLGKK
jgi:hypothetical protein